MFRVACVRSVIKSLSPKCLTMQTINRPIQHTSITNSQSYLTKISAALGHFISFAAVKPFVELVSKFAKPRQLLIFNNRCAVYTPVHERRIAEHHRSLPNIAKFVNTLLDKDLRSWVMLKNDISCYASYHYLTSFPRRDARVKC